MTAYEQGIFMPTDPVKLINLAEKIYARHCVMGDESPLLALQSNSWEENGQEVNNALRLQELTVKNVIFAQEYFCKRDELIIKIKASIQASHDLLSDIYCDNPKELAYWGFDTE